MFQPEPDELPDDLPNPADTHQAHQLELLTVCEAFLRTASPTVHNELREFLAAQGHHPTAGLPAFLDQLAFTLAPTTEQGGAK